MRKILFKKKSINFTEAIPSKVDMDLKNYVMRTKALKYYLTFVLICIASIGFSQQFETPVVAFNQAANEYIYQGTGPAVRTLNSALQQFPEDEKLQALLEKILKDKKDQEQQQNQQDQNQEDQQNQQEQDQQQDQSQNEEQKENQEQEQQNQNQNQDSQEKAEEAEDAEKKDQGQNAQPQQAEQEGEDQENSDPPQVHQNLEEMNISPEKAKMILDAMKNNEIQYIQQMERRPTQRPDHNKPDW